MKQYLICLKTESFPGVFKIVLTKEEPNELRNRMNADEVMPFPMVIDFAKEIEVTSETLKCLEAMLAIAGQQYGTVSGWWKIQWDFIAAVFAFHAGEWCTIYLNNDSLSAVPEASVAISAEIKTPMIAPPEYKSDDISGEDDDILHDKTVSKKYLPNMGDYFNHGQLIRHSRGSISSPWVGSYNALSNTITLNEASYSTMSAFATAHYKDAKLDRKGSGWVECEYDHPSRGWMSTKNMPRRA